jgi:hypothetical protein
VASREAAGIDAERALATPLAPLARKTREVRLREPIVSKLTESGFELRAGHRESIGHRAVEPKAALLLGEQTIFTPFLAVANDM